LVDESLDLSHTSLHGFVFLNFIPGPEQESLAENEPIIGFLYADIVVGSDGLKGLFVLTREREEEEVNEGLDEQLVMHLEVLGLQQLHIVLLLHLILFLLSQLRLL
jgi:hypothetical protein